METVKYEVTKTENFIYTQIPCPKGKNVEPYKCKTCECFIAVDPNQKIITCDYRL